MGSVQEIKQGFARQYGRAEGVRVFRGPGRVNLIGEHTDYNLGFVLPMALDMASFVAAAPNDTGKLRIWSENLQAYAERPIDSLGSAVPAKHWSDYPVGVAQQLVHAGFDIPGTDLFIHSTVPVGSGLSSSAALETSTALALLAGRPMEKLELVKLCRRAENHFVGMPCGIMDQYISVFGREGAAVKIDCRSLENEVAPLPASVSIFAVNTMVKHELGASAYRDRVRECAEAASALGVSSLRDVSVEQFEANAGKVPPVPRKRAKHVVTEDDRVQKFMLASREGDLKRMGELFVASHRSLQHDYEVSCEELDFLVDTAIGLPGVYGARMTGGGFGGCTVNLVQPEQADAFKTAIKSRYQERFNLDPVIYDCIPAAGACEL